VTLFSLPKEKGLKAPCKNLSLSFKVLQTVMPKGHFTGRGDSRAVTPLSICASAVFATSACWRHRGTAVSLELLTPLHKRGKFQIACSLILIKCKYACVLICICLSLCVYLWYKAPDKFACYPYLVSFPAVSDPVTAASPLNDGKGNFITLRLVSAQKGQGEEKNLLPAVSFSENSWVNLPFVFSSSIYSPVQQLPADSWNQENR